MFLNNQLSMPHYHLCLTDESLKITMKKMKIGERLLEYLFVSFIVGSLMLVFIVSLMNFGKALPYAIISGLILVFSLLYLVHIIVIEHKRPKVYSITINTDGIRHCDVNSAYFISWNDLKSYGVINGNPKDLGKYAHETCIYFSKKNFHEVELRKMFRQIGLRWYMHASTPEIIVFNMLAEDDDNRVYQAICEYVSKYSRLQEQER